MTDRQLDDLSLRRAWRRQSGSRPMPAAALTEALEGLQDGASAAQRERSAQALAEDARAADLGRALWSINAEARVLETEMLAQARPRRAARMPRALLALAAMLALAAVIALPQWQGTNVQGGGAEDSLIATSSFETGSDPSPTGDPDLLFRGGFDS